MVTFVLIHGAGDVGWYWHLVEAELRSRGHDTVAPDLPATTTRPGSRKYAQAGERHLHAHDGLSNHEPQVRATTGDATRSEQLDPHRHACARRPASAREQSAREVEREEVRSARPIVVPQMRARGVGRLGSWEPIETNWASSTMQTYNAIVTPSRSASRSCEECEKTMTLRELVPG